MELIKGILCSLYFQESGQLGRTEVQVRFNILSGGKTFFFQVCVAQSKPNSWVEVAPSCCLFSLPVAPLSASHSVVSVFRLKFSICLNYLKSCKDKMRWWKTPFESRELLWRIQTQSKQNPLYSIIQEEKKTMTMINMKFDTRQRELDLGCVSGSKAAALQKAMQWSWRFETTPLPLSPGVTRDDPSDLLSVSLSVKWS